MLGRKHQAGAKSQYPAPFRREVALAYEEGNLSYAQVAEKYVHEGSASHVCTTTPVG
jgi:hypothetical protein